MNSLDQEKLDAAMGIISNAMGLIDTAYPTAAYDSPTVQDWRSAARAWLDSYGKPVSPRPKVDEFLADPSTGTTRTRPERGESRWKTIEPDGSVGELSTLPVPDYDEGETGPPETQR